VVGFDAGGVNRLAQRLQGDYSTVMAKKDMKVEKGLSRATDLILDLLKDLPKEKAAKAKREIRDLALKSSRSSYRGTASQSRRTAGPRRSRRSRAKYA
jgi:hypothetical protein